MIDSHELENLVNIVLCTTGSRIDELKKNLNSLLRQDSKIFLIIVSQGNHNAIEEILKDYPLDHLHIKDTGKGLSRGRNLAIQYLKKGILLFADDDNWYPDHSIDYVNNYLISNNSDIVCFNYYDIDNDLSPKKYPSKRINSLSYRMLLKVSSIEIAINLNQVRLSDIKFDETLGIGTSIPSGEENKLLTELKIKKYRIEYYPFVLSYHPYKLRNTKKLDKVFFASKKQMFEKIYGQNKGKIVYYVFYIKKKIFSLFD